MKEKLEKIEEVLFGIAFILIFIVSWFLGI